MAKNNANAKKRLTQKQLDKILDKHEKWLAGKFGGKRAVLEDLDLSRLDLSRRNLNSIIIRNSYLVATNISGSDLTRAEIYNSNFYGARLDGANMEAAILANGTTMREVDFYATNMRHMNAEKVNFENSNMVCVDAKGAEFTECNFAHVDMAKSNLSDIVGENSIQKNDEQKEFRKSVPIEEQIDIAEAWAKDHNLDLLTYGREQPAKGEDLTP